MELRVLGSVEIHGGHKLAIGGEQHRRLVAALALRPNEVVSVDRLADILWSGTDQPKQPERNVRTYVSRIRDALGDAAGRRLVTAAPGYVLQLQPDELDAQRFEDGCSAAHRASMRDEPESAVALVGEALELWRGTPYDRPAHNTRRVSDPPGD